MGLWGQWGGVSPGSGGVGGLWGARGSGEGFGGHRGSGEGLTRLRAHQRMEKCGAKVS